MNARHMRQPHCAVSSSSSLSLVDSIAAVPSSIGGKVTEADRDRDDGDDP